MRANGQMLVCYCCRERYERGRYRCCAPQNGMRAHVWRASYCRDCRKCPKHCVCLKPNPEESPRFREPLDMSSLKAILETPTVKEWMPYREPGEEG